MFEKFTDRSRRVVVLAQEEARLLGHNYIGSEHVLLGLIAEAEGTGARALTNLGFSADYIRGRIEEIIGRGSSEPSGHIPFTPRANKILEFSNREALQLGHNYIGTEHILLGLIHEGESQAVVILLEKTDLATIRTEVINLLHSYQPKTQQAARAVPLPDPSPSMDAILVCTSALDLLDARRRAAALAFLASWYSGSDDAS